MHRRTTSLERGMDDHAWKMPGQVRDTPTYNITGGEDNIRETGRNFSLHQMLSVIARWQMDILNSSKSVLFL